MEDNLKFLLFKALTILASILLFLIFGWLGLCGMFDCLGSGRGNFTRVLISAAVFAMTSVPFAVTSYILYQKLRNRPVGKWTSVFGWAVLLIIGALGLFQVIVDPGDALWAGLPMMIFSGFFALSILSFPIPKIKPSSSSID